MMTREQKLDAVYRNTPKDYKGEIDGERTVMIYRKGTCLVCLKDLTDAEIEHMLPASMRRPTDTELALRHGEGAADETLRDLAKAPKD